MATISVSLPSDGTAADVSDYNTPITTIVNEINGNLDNANIKSGAAIATSKLADDAGITTAKIADGAVTNAKLGTDAIAITLGTVTSTGDLSTSYVSCGELASLPAGTWLIMACGIATFSVAQDTSVTGRVRNTTDGTDVLASATTAQTDYPGSASDTRFPWTIITTVTLASAKTIQIQFVASTGTGTTVVSAVSLVALKVTSVA